MKLNCNKKELEKLIETKYTNMDIADLYLDFLNNYYGNIDEQQIKQIMEKEKLSNTQAFFLAFLIACQIEIDDAFQRLAKKYELNSIAELDINDYLANPYYKNIKPVKIKNRSWSLEYNDYLPYEGFIYQDIDVDKEEAFIERTRLAFFSKKFPYLVLIQNNKVWMSITPHEINTMKSSIQEAYGQVLINGLGLGYYAYMCSLKDEVKSITIIEKDPSAIDIFKTAILPQFSHPEKVSIIKDDAISYSATTTEHYDYVFTDLWHDEEDGLPLYLKMLQTEKEGTKYAYWIEDSLLIMLRRCIITLIEEQEDGKTAKDYQKANNSLDSIINKLFFLLNDFQIDSYEDVKKLLDNDSLKSLAKKISL